MKNCARILLAFGACAALLLPTGCGDDDGGGGGGGGNGDPTGLEVPQEWLGVWENTLTTTPCADASGSLMRETTVDTFLICPDAVNAFDDEEFEAFADLCTETIDGNTYRIVCQGTETVFGTCSVDLDVDVAAVFSPTGDSYSFSGRYEAIASPGCGGTFADFCEEVDGTAVRISTSTEGCDGGDGGGDDGGSGGNSLDITVTGSGGASNVSFGENEIFLTVVPQGQGWGLTATNLATDFTNFQAFGLAVPPNVTTGSGWSVSTTGTDTDVGIEFTDARGGVGWELVTFDGLATISTLTSTRLAGSLSGS